MATYKWSIDPSHSEVAFKVKHLMITMITGYFGKFTLDLETTSNDFNTAKNIAFKAEINSIKSTLVSTFFMRILRKNMISTYYFDSIRLFLITSPFTI